MIVMPGFRRRALFVALAGVYGMGAQLAHANPTGAQVANGQAAFQTQGSKLTVTNTPGAIINWQSFSIDANQSTYFQQQSAASTVLNRVQVQNPGLKSQIDGALGSNGRVFLINPNGIVFGAGSVIDTQGFVASTLNLNDADFKSGRLRFNAQAAAGNIDVKGRISSGSGDVYLVAPNIGVDGKAVITADGGNIVLAAGEMVEITGRNLNDIKFEVQSKDNQVINLGTLSGGAIGVFAGTLNHSGLIKAQTLVSEGGRLVLKAQSDVKLGAGSKTVADGETLGGSITIASQTGNVVLDTGAVVSADARNAASALQATTRGGDVSLQAGGIVALEHDSRVSAEGGKGGSITVSADKLFQDGALRADGTDTFGGNVSVQAGSRILQTGSALVSAMGVAHGGTISLSVDADPVGAGSLFSSATIDAGASTGVGGNVTIVGHDLTFAGARIRANGDAGGGSLRMGGGRAGADSSVANAQNVVVNAASSFEASARADGDGGTIVAWADGTNKFAGVVEARGGAKGGDGGFIEVSGKHETQFGGTANASAPFGKNGTFLLDPNYILIQAPAAVAVNSVELFGSSVRFPTTVNGNILVFNPQDNFFGSNAGAIYLYDGVSGALISNLHGSAVNDQVGSSGVVRNLSPGMLLIGSPLWNASAGALTPFNVSTGLSGSISSANSLVGSSAGDQIGSGGLFGPTLSSGVFPIYSPNWNGAAGAITWANASTGVTGTVSAANSLVGTNPNDRVGNFGSQLVQLNTGKFYVLTSAFNSSAGAFTWIDGAAPPVGVIGSANSLVGSAAADRLGNGGITQLSNGNYLILSPNYTGSAGAVTWANGSAAIRGSIGNEVNGNSIFGSAPGDGVGNGGIQFLDQSGCFSNCGNFVVASPNALGGSVSGKGAITFGTPASGFLGSGVVSSTNSLVGSNAGDHIGSGGVTQLFNRSAPAFSNYLIESPDYNTDTSGARTGAVTWASGAAAIRGTIGAETNGNSVRGNVPGDSVGSGGIEFLNSGNFVVLSPDSSSVNSPGQVGVGAVSFGTQSSGFASTPGFGISASNSLVGSNANDHVGSGGVIGLNNGNYVVLSPNWSGSTLSSNLGAVTWGDGNTGVIPAQVSTVNSLIGSSSNDRVGSAGVTTLSSTGNYVVQSPNYAGGAGAVTWASGTSAVTGTIGASTNGNSIFGNVSGDSIGNAGVQELGNGNFAVFSPNFHNGTVVNAGAFTWGNGNSGFALPGGVNSVNSANSLVGTNTGDSVGINPGSNFLDRFNYYLLRSPSWNGSAGAVSFSSGTSALTGAVGAANSLVGSTAGDNVGSTIQFLNNGDYVVLSPNWANTASVPQAGAVTFGDLATGVAGLVSSNNSLVGTSTGDRLGSNGITQMPRNSNFLIFSPNFNGGRGAVTFAFGANAVSGTVGAETNGSSIFGASTTDRVGSNGANLLFNSGNFAVRSLSWGNGAGAVTWGSSANGFAIPGVVSSLNSVTGTLSTDQIGSGGLQELSSGNYLIKSPSWNLNAGAVTFASGTAATVGAVGSADGHSVVGQNATDTVGSGGIQLLNNGNFLVMSPNWANGAATQAGAVTWGDMTSGFVSPGLVSSANSLVGTSTNDRVGNGGLRPLFVNGFSFNGNYLLSSPNWSGNAGALTWFNQATPLIGNLSAANSLVGASAGDGVGTSPFTNVQFIGNQYLVFTPNWANGTATQAGAVTWGDQNTGVSGVVSSTNSLVGSNTGDQVGISSGFPSVLQGISGGLVIRSANWNSGSGALTFVPTGGSATGVVGAANSLVGATVGDSIGSQGIQALTNNKIAVFSPGWHNGAASNAGAVSWLDATAPSHGFIGTVTTANSVVGSSANDQIGSAGIQQITSNLYALRDANWGNGAATNAGAITWVNTAGTLPVGAVSAANSLVGSNTNDAVGNTSTFTLGNSSNYLVTANRSWNGNRGAVSWMTTAAPLTGAISSANSLVGVNTGDQVGSGGIRTSSNTSQSFLNGDYIVLSPSFNSRIGAITVGSGASGISGVVSSSNSLVGFGTNFQMVNTRTRMLVGASLSDSEGLVNNGRVCLYAGGAGCVSSVPLSLPQSFATNPAGSITITPAQIIAILNTGTDVVLEANSDITLDALSDVIASNPAGNGGKLILHAGRSVLLNSNITTDNGDVNIVANARAANQSNRDAGIASITMADGTKIDAGTGRVDILLDGAGPNAGSADLFSVNLRSITAGSLAVNAGFGGINIGSPAGIAPALLPANISFATTMPSTLQIGGDVDLTAMGTVRLAGASDAPTLLSATGQISIDAFALRLPTNARIESSFVGSASKPPIFLTANTLCDATSCLRVGSNVITSPTSNISELIANLLLANLPFPSQEHDHKSEGDIEIEAGETCK